ncbi:hypothetical protein KSD_59710 [Ktedonobacter sp. SOSP1-85]|nr:hypothetical protein KSD_59710 [Ktedonobacter sp. SOSP1-85]
MTEQPISMCQYGTLKQNIGGALLPLLHAAFTEKPITEATQADGVLVGKWGRTVFVEMQS